MDSGRNWKIANNNATAVNAFSPPLSNELLKAVLPGGVAMISTPGSRSSFPSAIRKMF
jgi:hypothetical protein